VEVVRVAEGRVAATEAAARAVAATAAATEEGVMAP
jgi:hypothetical protein